MTLIDAYLFEVSKNLAARDRSDIIAELQGNIEDAIEQRQHSDDTLDSDAATRAVLAGFGHPLKVAASYSEQQYLLGPDLYPIYIHILKTLTTLIVSVQLVVSCMIGVAAQQSWQGLFAGLFSQLLTTGLWVAVIITAVFIAIQRSGEKLGWYERWQPSDLNCHGFATIDRGDLFTNLLTAVIFLLWWNGALFHSAFLQGHAEVMSVTLSAPWQLLFWPLNLVVGGSALLYLLVLNLGRWQYSTIVSDLALNALLIAMGLWLLGSGPLLQLDSTSMGPGLTSDALQRTVRIALVVIMGFVLWDMWLAWQRLRQLQHQPPQSQGSAA